MAQRGRKSAALAVDATRAGGMSHQTSIALSAEEKRAETTRCGATQRGQKARHEVRGGRRSTTRAALPACRGKAADQPAMPCRRGMPPRFSTTLPVQDRLRSTAVLLTHDLAAK